MNVQTFRKKPVEVQAVQWWPKVSTGANHAIMDWLISSGYPYLVGNALEPTTLEPLGEPGIYIDPSDGALVIRTLEGDMKVSDGDWIIRGTRDEFYPCKPGPFADTFEAVRPGGEPA